MAAPGLIGRDRELGVLASLIDQAEDGGAAIVVLGDPGIGKSSLLRAAADYARRQWLQEIFNDGVPGDR